jgi:dehydrogenase/reductase SDR family member 7B
LYSQAKILSFINLIKPEAAIHMDYTNLNGKVVIITGASSGIGMACAEEFASAGAKLVLAARQEDKLEAIEARLKGEGREILTVKTDVSREEDCRNLIDRAYVRFGKIDVLLNNAGISMRALFSDLDLDIIRKLMDTNFWGAVYCTKYALPYLLETRGSVIGVSSIAGKKGLPSRTGYSASKFALEGFLETLRIENLNNGLHVFVVCPGFTASNIRNAALSKDGTQQGESPRDEKKMMQPEDVAKAIVKGVITRKRELIMTSQGRLTIFLNKFFPAWVDRLVFNTMAKEANSPLSKGSN